MASRFDTIPEHEIALEVGGQAYFGWTALEVDRGIDSLAGSFALTVASKESTAAANWEIADGAPCKVTLAGATLITGHVDTITRAIGPEERGLELRGRDKTADLVDCSALHTPGSWRGRTLQEIASELLEPFGIALELAGDTGAPFKRFALQQGETVFAALERMARYRGLVLWSRGDGRVRIGAPDTGNRAGSLVEGVNVTTARGDRDTGDRFSEYLVKGQASGDDERSGAAVAQVQAQASDSGVGRYRPLLLIGEEQSDTASLQARADWEASVRQGRARPASITAPGWFGDNGVPWHHGARVYCAIPSIRLQGDMLIERVRLTRSAEDGTLAELSVVPPEAWAQLAEAEEAP